MMLIFTIDNGKTRIIRGVDSVDIIKTSVGLCLAWFRNSSSLWGGIALTLAYIERRYKYVIIINQQTTMGELPIFIFNGKEWTANNIREYHDN